MQLILIFTTLGFGNFLYQLTSGNYDYFLASERTYFQGVALFVYYIMNTYIWKKNEQANKGSS